MKSNTIFLAAKNLTSGSLEPTVPWDFKITDEPGLQIRKVKEDRQDWYKSATTVHNFYTGIEPLNPNLRLNKEHNPAKYLNAFVADYDVHCSDQRIDEAIAAMKIKPAWVETSLGGNFRLVWPLPFRLKTGDTDFTVLILQQAVKWLHLGLLPGLDEKAFTETTRLYCNGGVWRATGFEVREVDLQAFFVDCGKKFRFKVPDEAAIPLDIVEAELKVKFPETFNWPAAFELDSQGPSFWVPGSTSTNSAIVKPEGMFTFAAHAESPFYSWGKILGSEFVKEFETNSIAKATKDCFYDSKKYWRKREGYYISMDKEDFVLFLKVDCRLSGKVGPEGFSQIDLARQHIHNHSMVTSAAPFVFRKPGLIEYQGEPRLNTYRGKPINPAAGAQKWGPHGEFPLLSFIIDHIFDPQEKQKDAFLAWFKHFYRCAFEWDPMGGQYICLSGGVGCGKTLINRQVIGNAVGGYTDASDFLVNQGTFNSHLMKCPHWCLDDDNPSNSSGSQTKASSMFKKMAGNQQFLNNEKFQVAGMVEWMGRIGITTNLDFTSMRILGSMDNNCLDKMCLFKCVEKPPMLYPNRNELEAQIAKELPHFLRWLLDWTPPAWIVRNGRFGYEPYHNDFLMERAHQGSSVAPFTEILRETLVEFFRVNQEQEFRGTTTQIHRLITNDPRNDHIMRAYKPEQINRHLEQLQKEKLIACDATSGSDRTRIWTFKRIEPPTDTTPRNNETDLSQ